VRIPWGSRTIELPEPDLRLCDKLCSNCQAKNSHIKKKDTAKTWMCKKCGTEHDRETNKEKNANAFFWNALSIRFGFVRYGSKAAKNRQLRDGTLQFADKVFQGLVDYLYSAGRSDSKLICAPDRIRQLRDDPPIWAPRAGTLDFMKMLDHEIRRYVETKNAAAAAYFALLLGQISFSLAVHGELEQVRHTREVNSENKKKEHRTNSPLIQQGDDLIRTQWNQFLAENRSDSIEVFCESHLPEYLEKQKFKLDDPTSRKKVRNRISSLSPARIRQILGPAAKSVAKLSPVVTIAKRATAPVLRHESHRRFRKPRF
jgi:hypothetical protein